MKTLFITLFLLLVISQVFGSPSEAHQIQPGETFFGIITEHYQIKQDLSREQIEAWWEFVMQATHNSAIPTFLQPQSSDSCDEIQAGKWLFLPYLGSHIIGPLQAEPRKA